MARINFNEFKKKFKREFYDSRANRGITPQEFVNETLDNLTPEELRYLAHRQLIALLPVHVTL